MSTTITTLRSNIGTITILFEWSDNIATDQRMWIGDDSVECMDDETIQEAIDLIAYAVGEGETPKPGMEYKAIRCRFSFGDAWTWQGYEEDNEAIGPFLFATVEKHETR